MSDCADRIDAFTNVRDQIGFCGIWCGSCVVGNGALRELTERYRRLIDGYGLESWAPNDLDYRGFVEGLGAIATEASCSGCRQGGGRDACPMRTCARNKRTEHCMDCADSHTCAHGDDVSAMRSGARSAGLFVRPAGAEEQSLVERWARDLRSDWPSSILFDGEAGSDLDSDGSAPGR